MQSSGFVKKLAEKLLSGPHMHCTASVGQSSGITGRNLPFQANVKIIYFWQVDRLVKHEP
jgi:hypothetical protein